MYREVKRVAWRSHLSLTGATNITRPGQDMRAHGLVFSLRAEVQLPCMASRHSLPQ